MKRYVTILVLCLPVFSLAQDSYKRTYYIPKNIVNRLLIQKKVAYDSLDTAQQKKYRSKFKEGEIIKYWIEKEVNGEKVKMEMTDTINDDFFSNQIVIQEQGINRANGLKSFVKLDKNKLYINPFLNKGVDQDEVYYLTLKNREKIWLPFTEFAISSLTIPLKYRGANNDLGIDEEFTSSFNLNFIMGFAYGNSSFMYRKGVDNKSNTWKITAGFVTGASTLTLNSENTSTADEPIKTGDSIDQGLVSLGYGLSYSYDNVNFGLFGGWDYSIGSAADKWNYNGRPWFGIGVGYSLFKL